MIPKTITIGCYNYDVIETEDVIIVDNITCKGCIEYDNKVIKIKADMAEQQKEQTFWHEVMHGIINYRTFNPEKCDMEVTVEEISLGLYGVMKANGLLPGQVVKEG